MQNLSLFAVNRGSISAACLSVHSVRLRRGKAPPAYSKMVSGVTRASAALSRPAFLDSRSTLAGLCLGGVDEGIGRGLRAGFGAGWLPTALSRAAGFGRA